MTLFPLDFVLRRLINYGRLTVIDTDGRAEIFGTGEDGPRVTARIVNPAFRWKAAWNPEIAVGEAYVDGDFVIEEGTLRDFLDVTLISLDRKRAGGAWESFRVGLDELVHRHEIVNRIGRAEQNVRHHYDIDHRLYELFLDKDMQYSCAYWREGTQSIEQAQIEKKRHLAAKLLLEPGMEVLDIGSGWGGLALHLAREHGVKVTGVTLSTDQYETSVRRAEQEGLSDRVTFKLLDYRLIEGAFDRIVSVGMFEHVGRPHYAEFFRHVERLMKPAGVTVLHTIGRMTSPEPINGWVRRYIFPGAYLPTLSQLSPILERQRLMLTDFENWRLHYAKTLHAWDQRFQEKREEVRRMFDERFCRMWEFYLQGCEAGFKHQGLTVFQMQIAKQIEAVPLTRDYIYAGGRPAHMPSNVTMLPTGKARRGHWGSSSSGSGGSS